MQIERVLLLIMSQSLDHEIDHCQLDQTLADHEELLIMFAQASIEASLT
jgi:hypothetical protein